MISICVLLRPASPLVHNAPFVPIINQSDSNWAYPIHIEWVEASHPSGLLKSPEHLTKSDYRKRLQLSRFLLFSSKAIAFLFELSDANVQRLYLQSWKKGGCFHVMLQRVPSKYWFCKTMHYVPSPTTLKIGKRPHDGACFILLWFVRLQL